VSLSPGNRLGPYEILAPLGAGGMGEVYRARDTRLGRDVAIKVLPAQVASDVSRLKRFEKEARAASGLNHPNIVTIYDIGASDSQSWIAMELVEGRTLRELLVGDALPVKRLLPIGTQVAEGLAQAHDAGIVHRDLKPENVMVTKEGRVKILDFGLAKLTGPVSGSDSDSKLPTQTGTSPGVILGTVSYMSPEQAAGQQVDFRSDQFSFGSILYEMATGKRAFQRGTALRTLTAIVQEEPEAIESLTPAPIRWLSERCLAKDPRERYASTQDLARDLSNLMNHLSEATSSAGMALLAQPRPRAWNGYVLAVLAALIAVGSAYWVGVKKAERPPPSYQRLTFRRGTVYGARFTSDGQTVVYSAAWEGQPPRVFVTRAGSVESRGLQLPDARILAVSGNGELAISIGRETAFSSAGTLARVPLEGGAPRELLENVSFADWSPDGRDLAIIHEVGARSRLEFPIGKVLYETFLGGIASVRFSPKGDRLAILRGEDIVAVDLSGKTTTLSKGWDELSNLAWRPDGGEIWFSGQRGPGKFALHAVTLSGRERLVRREAGHLVLFDISRDGRVLLDDVLWNSGLVALPAGESSERDLSWMDRPEVTAISNDGRFIVFTEWGEGRGGNWSIYLRAMDGSAAVRLGEGYGMAISPDGRWVMAQPSQPPEAQVLLPTGPGQPRLLKHPGMETSWGRFFPDGKRVLFLGDTKTSPSRLYVQGLDGGEARAISPEGMSDGPRLAISPDGHFVAAQDSDKKIAIYAVDGGTTRPLAGAEAGESPVLWSADGESLYVYRWTGAPARVFKIDILSGKRELWKTIAPADPAGLLAIVHIVMTPDAHSYAYNYTRKLSSLQVAEGLR
jgi:Tol biopolymer transport system component